MKMATTLSIVRDKIITQLAPLDGFVASSYHFGTPVLACWVFQLGTLKGLNAIGKFMRNPVWS